MLQLAQRGMLKGRFICIQFLYANSYVWSTSYQKSHRGLFMSLFLTWQNINRNCGFSLFACVYLVFARLLTCSIKVGSHLWLFWPRVAHLDRKRLSDWYGKQPTAVCLIFMGGGGLIEEVEMTIWHCHGQNSDKLHLFDHKINTVLWNIIRILNKCFIF